MTSIDDLRGWYNDGKKQKATHMIVVCDTFDYEDYPVYVLKGQDAKAAVAKCGSESMHTVMEVYSYNKTFQVQSRSGKRVFNYD